LALKVNGACRGFAKKLIGSGDIDEGEWSFGASDGDKLLGPDGDDWGNYAKYHLAIDADAEDNTKERYKYPIGKDGKVYRRALIAAKSRAAQQDEDAVADAASALLTECNKKLGMDAAHDAPGVGTVSVRLRADFPGQVTRLDVIDGPAWMTRPFERTPEGYLTGRAVVTNVGVFEYANPDGTVRRELRLPEEVFAAASLDSLKLKPITNDHPAVLVTVENAAELEVGSIGSAISKDPAGQMHSGMEDWKDGTPPSADRYHVTADMVIRDPETITDVLAGKRSLSCGYTCALEDKSGVWMGVPYDTIQREIRYNHVAIVDRARAGDAARIRLDRADDTRIQVDRSTTKREEQNMPELLKEITLDSVTYKAEAKVIEALGVATKRADTADGELKTQRVQLDTVTGERDALKAANVKLDAKVKELETAAVDPKRLADAVQSRIAVLDAAKRAGIDVATILPEQTDDEIRRAVILKVSPDTKLDGKSAEYVTARFDMVADDLAKGDAADAANRADASTTPTTSADASPVTNADAAKAREEYAKRQREAWRQPASAGAR
jgi:hypothetical protein